MSAGHQGTAAPEEATLVLAARAGDEHALGDLVAAYMPLVYNIVHRALGGTADVDDVVQDILLLVVRDLPNLREPGSFRGWLLAITFHQISTYRKARRQSRSNLPLGEAEQAVAGSDVQDVALLRLDLSGQRRQVLEASRWLDPDQRALLALWWQENAGLITRAELAQAIDLSVAHAGVRLHRMREQLELGRRIAAALSARPRCTGVGAVVADWDGRPTPLWRKRIGRHVSECQTCLRASAGQIAVERLLFTFAAIPVPLGLAAAAVAKALLWTPASGAVAATVHTSLVGKLTQALAAHPLATLATGAVLMTVPAVTYATLPETKPPAVFVEAPPTRPSAPEPVRPSPSPPPSAKPSPSRSATAPGPGLAVGSWSLEVVGAPGQYVSYAGSIYATVSSVTKSSATPARQRATFTVVPGLADARCYTFRAADGRYLRHAYLRLQLSPEDATQLFREDATFCVRPGSVAGSITLQSHNYPGSVLRFRDGGIYLDGSDGTKEFARDSSFVRRGPWAA